MAYNSNGAYEPPRRAYYGQQPAPPQGGYGYSGRGQYDNYHEEQQTYEQGYDQGYTGQYDQYNNGYGQDMRQGRKPRSPGYNEGYNPGYQDGRQQGYMQNGGYERQPRQAERQYDPRYQQRQERGRQQNYEQQPRQPRKQPSQQQVQDSRPNPRQARMYTQESQAPAQSYQQPTAAVAPQPRTNANVNNRPQTAPQPEKKQEQPNRSMEEWKAKERARMHAEAALPETLAWDNAFPVFPTARERSRAAEDRKGTDSAMGHRASGEQLRPDGQQHKREASMSRNNSDPSSYNRAEEQQLSRPPMEHKPHSFGQPNQGQDASPSKQLQPRPQLHRQASDQAPMSVEAEYPDQSSMRQSPPAMQMQARQGPAGGPPQQYRNEQPPPQAAHQGHTYTRQPPPRGPAPQRIDTRQAQQAAQPGYMDHQPMSPAQVPPRPSTSQGPRSPLGQSVMSPSSAHPALQTPQGSYQGRAAEPPGPSGQQRSGSLDDIYGGYQDNRRVPPPATAPVRTRDQEIEAEMPDFDSAAPGGTSLLHKRSQHSTKSPVSERTPVQNMQQQQYNQSAQSLPAQQQQFYGQHNQTSASLPNQRGMKPKQGGITNGFVFGVPGENVPQSQYEDQYQQRGAPYHQHPPQPPFANERPRRSMDDARQMPYRQGPPPQQQFHQNGQPPRRPPPQQQRSGDRNFSGPPMQRPYGDPMDERVGSAPPTRQHFQEPPPPQQPMGAPLAQQRSAPERPRQRHRHSNPDSLPMHPTPVRPGLMDNGPAQPAKPPPVRRHPENAPPPQHQRAASISNDTSTHPVTKAELAQLRAAVDANPQNSRQALLFAKKLAEAAFVLAPEGGDQRTTASNRERYINEAHKRVKKLVSAGYPDAQFYMADCYGQGTLGLPVDSKEAFRLYQAAAKAGHPQAAYRTAMCCELGAQDGGGISQDYAKAVQWYRRGAALGDPDAMFKIGIILLKGLLGQPRNVGEAVNFLKRAAPQAGQDNPHALHELAQLYESTNTNPEVRNKVVADDRYALELFQQAANAGLKASQFRLGQAYEYGHLDLPIDNRASITWYTKAAAQAHHEAELALSGWYLTGADGILEHSDTEAYLWARKAASSEPPLAKAMFAMGYFTETGIGCPANIEEAKRWYGRAASYKFPKAQERLEDLRRNGSKGSKPVNGKLTRKDQKKDEENCVMM